MILRQKTQNSDGNLYLTENRLGRTKYGMRKIIRVICAICVQKDFKIRTLIKQLLTKYQFFMKLPQISHIRKNDNFQVQLDLFRPTASTI